MAATNNTKFLSYTQYENTLARLSATANTYVLSSITVDGFGHVTAVARKALAAADIPNLAAGKITSGTFGVARGGTGKASWTPHSMIYASDSTTLSEVAPNTSATRKFLRMTGTGGSSPAGAAPAWDTLSFGDLPTLYVGTTAVQSSSAAQALTGISSVKATSAADSLFEWDSANGAWHFKGNVYSDGWISAYGVSGGGSGGGSGVSVLRDWQNLDPDNTLQVLGANLADGLRTRIAALENSSTNVSFTRNITSGKEIGTITIDGTGTKIYAPGTYALSDITGAEDLKAIEAITGTSGVLQKTAANTWSLVSKTDSSSASAISTGTGLVTERDVYHGLPKINNAHSYTSSSAYYAPTTGGTAGYLLKAKGATSAPEWDSVANIMGAYATTEAMNAAISAAIGGVTQFSCAVAWNGSSAPTVADIPKNVKVVYNGTTYTGTKTTGDAGKVYLVKHSHGTNDVYDEYMYLNGAWEKLGNTDIDLSGHWAKGDLVAITGTENTALLDAYFPV